jgi:hypothetical protein
MLGQPLRWRQYIPPKRCYLPTLQPRRPTSTNYVRLGTLWYVSLYLRSYLACMFSSPLINLAGTRFTAPLMTPRQQATPDGALLVRHITGPCERLYRGVSREITKKAAWWRTGSELQSAGIKMVPVHVQCFVSTRCDTHTPCSLKIHLNIIPLLCLCRPSALLLSGFLVVAYWPSNQRSRIRSQPPQLRITHVSVWWEPTSHLKAGVKPRHE